MLITRATRSWGTVQVWLPDEWATDILGGTLDHATATYEGYSDLDTHQSRAGLAWLVRPETELLYPRVDGSDGSFYPDIIVAHDVRISPTEPYWVETVGKVPELIIEVLSPKTDKKDLDEEEGKALAYAQLGVGEYVTFDPRPRLDPSLIRVAWVSRAATSRSRRHLKAGSGWRAWRCEWLPSPPTRHGTDTRARVPVDCASSPPRAIVCCMWTRRPSSTRWSGVPAWRRSGSASRPSRIAMLSGRSACWPRRRGSRPRRRGSRPMRGWRWSGRSVSRRSRSATLRMRNCVVSARCSMVDPRHRRDIDYPCGAAGHRLDGPHPRPRLCHDP